MRQRPAIRLLLIILLACLGSCVCVFAQEETVQPINVAIVLDDSGSMAECTNPWDASTSITQCKGGQKPPSDLDALRYSAARLLIHLADPDDRIGVLRFDASTEQVLALQPAGEISNRDALSSKVQPPTSYRSRGYTRIDLGLSAAAKMLSGSPDRPSYVLFLTDGNPAGPDNINQTNSVVATMRELRSRGVQVFPIALCNGECPDAFLKTHMAQDQPVREARSASDLLRVFSEVFSEMKPTLHVVSGSLEFSVKDYHAVSELYFVTERGGLSGVTRSRQDVPVHSAFEDGNVLLSLVEYASIGQGDWKVAAANGGFVVARTKTYPELVHPPPAVVGSATAPHYYPAGRPALLVAQAVGPIGDAQLLFDGNTALKPLSMDEGLRWVQLPSDSAEVRLQIGADKKPLIINRAFRLVPVQGVPEARASMPECAANTACELKVTLQPGPAVQDLTAEVFVTDQSDSDRTVHENRNMVCAERECADATFRPQDGHVYQIRYLLSGINAQGQRYGDWVETVLPMRPAIYMRGLPEVLNLKQQPMDGWPVTVVVGTTEDLGKLRARITLTQVGEENAIPVAGLSVEFGADISGRQPEVQTTLRITGHESLSPGNYKGELEFYLDKPPVAAADILMPSPYSVVFNPAKAEVTVLTKEVDFQEVAFEPSANFRIDQSATVEVRFNDAPFQLNADDFRSPTCPDMRLTVVNQEERSDLTATLTLRLQSTGRVSDKDCSGQFDLVPSERPKDRTVNNGGDIPWQVRIRGIEWAILGSVVDGKEVSSVTFNNLTTPADAPGAEVTLVVNYSGKPPFKFEISDSTLTDTRRQERLGAADFTPVVMDIQPDPARAQTYRVKLQLVPARDLPSHWWFTRSFSGQLAFKVAGLPDMSAQRVDTFVNSTGWRDRKLIPFAMKWIVRPWWLWLIAALLAFILGKVIWLRRVADDDTSGSRPSDSQDQTSDSTPVAGPGWPNSRDGWAGTGMQTGGWPSPTSVSSRQLAATGWGGGARSSNIGPGHSSQGSTVWGASNWSPVTPSPSGSHKNASGGGNRDWPAATNNATSTGGRDSSKENNSDWSRGSSQAKSGNSGSISSWGAATHSDSTKSRSSGW